MDPSQTAEATATPTPERVPYTLWQLVRYFLRLGTLGFGGPVALVGYMQRDLVERRGWFTRKCPKAGLALSVCRLANVLTVSTSDFFIPARSAFS